MKKYLVFGMVLAVSAMLLSFSLMNESSADSGPPSFYGAAKAGRTISACKGGDPCYYTTATDNNTYAFPSNIEHGNYTLCDGCQHIQASYQGESQQVDFCIPNPPLFFCECN
jgi:hypothetical protein